jgi:hypothetical protein
MAKYVKDWLVVDRVREFLSKMSIFVMPLERNLEAKTFAVIFSQKLFYLYPLREPDLKRGVSNELLEKPMLNTANE